MASSWATGACSSPIPSASPLDHEEAPANGNETLLAGPLLDGLLGEGLELELLAGNSGFESIRVFDAINDHGMDGLIAWRRLKGRENPPDVLSMKDRIEVEGPEYKRVVYKRLRAMVEGFIGRIRCRLACGRLT